MNKQQKVFVENMGVFGASNGTPRSVSRVIGYMLICKPEAQTAKDIQDALGLSTGAVSNALTMLKKAEMVRPVSTHSHSIAYEIDPEIWVRTIEDRLRMIPQAINIVNEGLMASPNNTRLLTMHRVYSAFHKQMTDILKDLR